MNNSKVTYDSEGNELIEHTSKNHLNDMLPINVKASVQEKQSQSSSILGKRTKGETENGQID